MNDPAMTEASAVIDYFVDQGAPEPAPKATLERLVALAEQHKALEEEVHRDTVALEEKKAKLEKLSQDTIPSLLDELGMSEFKLSTGEEVAIKTKIRASISQENRAAAFAWLRERGDDGIIKAELKASFGRGEIEDAEKARKALEGIGVYAALDENVHHSTLASYVREQLEAGVALPLKVFGVFEQRSTEIKLPKARKKK